MNQRPTSLTYGANMAVSSITYTPWGAISTMCGGQGCAQSQETRQYNSRLQPVLMELGNSSNLSADYSLTYTYAGNSNPPCTIPQGAGDNGSITGETYTDNVNPGYSHTFTYCYDAVNRLTHAVASGSPAYDLMYSYDQYGNGTCVPGSGGGLCPAMSYNSSTNRLTSIGSTAVSYDAAGNQLNDIWSTYEYDAEGRVKHSYSSGQWQYPTYNALGQRVQDYQGIDPMTLTYPIDLFGQRTGAFAQWPSQNWTGWNVYWSQIAGQRLNMGGASAYIDHSDAVGSTTMETDPAGAVQWDVTHYPWGGVFQEQGARQSEVVMGLDWQVNDPVIPSATRELSSALGRWMTSDPLGGDVANPQSLNRYAYVGNNPTTLTDPLGLQSPQGLLKAEFRFHCLMDPVCNHWSSTGGYDYWTVGGYDVFDVMQIPVRASEWVPPQFAQSGDVLHLTTGHWETTTLGNATMVLDIPGINFTADSPTTGTFTSAFSFPQTVIKFKNSGFVQNVQDYADFFHPGQLDLRDKLTFCSAHVAINKSSGQVPRTPTTGDYHFDAINPWAQSPIPSVVDPSGLALPLGHLALDVLGLYPGSAACHP